MSRTTNLTLSFDLSKGFSGFSRYGLNWFTQMLFLSDVTSVAPNQLESILQKYEERSKRTLQDHPFLEGLDLNDASQTDRVAKAIQRLQAKCDNTPEYWAAIMLYDYIPKVRAYLEQQDAQGAAWAMAALVNAHSVFIFQRFFEEAIWHGHAVGKLKGLLQIWSKHKNNDNEKFWQRTLTENSLMLSQIFSFPVVVLNEQAYVGGKSIENTGGRLVDFLLVNHLSQNVVLVEIKTPKTQLLGPEYREGVYRISGELTGAIVQLSGYKDALLKEYNNLVLERIHQGKSNLYAFNPKCLVIAGTLSDEVIDHARNRSFELFRSGMRDVEIITYDEMFKRVEILLDLFGSDTSYQDLIPS